MGKLFKFLKPRVGAVLAIVAVLIIQAYCDLSLPGYTSDIVNVGIQQGGIDSAIPEQIAKDDMEKLLLFVSKDDQKIVMDAYTLDSKTYKKDAYVLKDDMLKDEDKEEKLIDILGKPMLLVSGFDSDSETSKQMKQAIFANVPQEMLTEDTTIYDVLSMMPEEQRLQMTKQLDEKMEEMPETMVEQAATIYIKSAYENLGIDMDKVQTDYMFATGAKMIALAFLGMAASVLVGLMASKVAAATGRDLRSGVFKKVVGFSNGEFDKFSTASLITRSTNDIQQIQMLTVMMLRLVIYAPILGLGGVFKVFHTNVSMSWIIALAVALILCVVIVLFVVAMPKFKMLQNLVDKLNLVTREILTGLSVIRAFSTEKHEEERFDKANKDLTRTNLFVNRAMTFMMPTMMLIMNGISVLIVWSGAHGINDGQMQVGDMMAFIQYTMQIIMAFLMICMISIMLPRAAVSATRVDEILTSETLIHDPKEPKQLPEDGKGVVKFDHVSFRYPGAEEDVLHDINFVAQPGETTAFIGSTGSGKSTLVNLIPRFYDPTEGEILLDGQNIRNVTLESLRSNIGVVQQDVYLFSGTVYENIAYGKTDATREEVIQAAKMAGAHEFIMELKDGYDTYVGERGVKLSGGQKQRISIARVMVRSPKLVILDEATASLDNESEHLVAESLDKLAAGRTTITIAHRLTTIHGADRILVLSGNHIVEEGNHETLMEKQGIYYQLYTSSSIQ